MGIQMEIENNNTNIKDPHLIVESHIKGFRLHSKAILIFILGFIVFKNKK